MIEFSSIPKIIIISPNETDTRSTKRGIQMKIKFVNQLLKQAPQKLQNKSNTLIAEFTLLCNLNICAGSLQKIFYVWQFSFRDKMTPKMFLFTSLFLCQAFGRQTFLMDQNWLFQMDGVGACKNPNVCFPNSFYVHYGLGF